MDITQIRWTSKAGWTHKDPILADAQLVMVFAEHDFFKTEECYTQLKEKYPQAHIVGCSSSGNILGVNITDSDIVATAIHFKHAHVKVVVQDINATTDLTVTAEQLMVGLNQDDLKHAFILSDGLLVNGTHLAQGLTKFGVNITGGLAGDGARFQTTWVMANAPAVQGRIAAIGFYGDVHIKTGCFAGWVEFGAERVVTKSTNNVVYEIDNQPALALYKKYLGEFANDLPASGLRFPLNIQATAQDRSIIRTLLAVDESTQSMTFAGDIPEGYLCKLMRTDIDSLIEHAGLAAEAAKPTELEQTSLCLIVSCVGRRLVMDQLTEDELEIVQDTLGKKSLITGFYSYGELAPLSSTTSFSQCQLHNQTMTMTTITE